MALGAQGCGIRPPGSRIPDPGSRAPHRPTALREPGVREAGVREGARLIEPRLEQRRLRIEHLGVRRHAGAEPLADDPNASVAARTPSSAAVMAARLESTSSRRCAHLERHLAIELQRPRLRRAGGGRRLGTVSPAAAAVPHRPGGIHRHVPGVLPDRRARKDARVGTGIVVSARDRHLGFRCRVRGRDTLARGSRAILQGTAFGPLAVRLVARARPRRGRPRRPAAPVRRRARCRRARPSRAAAAGRPPTTPRWLRGLDRQQPLTRLLRLGGQQRRSAESSPVRAGPAGR